MCAAVAVAAVARPFSSCWLQEDDTHPACHRPHIADFSKPADVVCVMTSEGIRDLLTYFFRRRVQHLAIYGTMGAIVLRCQKAAK